MACNSCGARRGHLSGCPQAGGSGTECPASTPSTNPEVHRSTKRHHCSRIGGHGRGGSEDPSRTHRCTCGYEWS